MQGIDNLLKGGGSSTLSDLTDVNFSSLTEGDLLIYDGAEWINHSFTEGHTILNQSGTAVTDEANLQFTNGLKVTDDDENNITKVEVDTTFTQAYTRTNIESGDTFSTILGKIKKWFADLPSLFVSRSGDNMAGPLGINSESRYSGIVIGGDWEHKTTATHPATILIGNSIPDGALNCCRGQLRIYGNGSNYTNVEAPDSTANRTITFPNADGIVALTSDIPDVSGKVNKSGDTMTGTLEVHINQGDTPIVVKSGVNTGSYIEYRDIDGNSLGHIGVKNDNKAYLYSSGTSKQLAFTSDVENATKVGSNVTPSSSGKSTLLAYVNDVIVPKQLGTYSFGASGFSDLPVNDWGYDVTVHRGGGTYVTIERQLSNGLIYSRGIDSGGQWVGRWAKLTNAPEVVQLFSNTYIDTADTWISGMNPGYTSIDDFDFIGLSWGIADRNSPWNTIQVLTTVSAFKNSSRSDPFVIIDDPFSPADAKRVMAAWAGDGLFGVSIDVYRGNQVYPYQRLNVLGIRI